MNDLLREARDLLKTAGVIGAGARTRSTWNKRRDNLVAELDKRLDPPKLSLGKLKSPYTWAAQDADGTWFAYAAAPAQQVGAFVTGGAADDYIRLDGSLFDLPKIDDWRNSVYQWSDETNTWNHVEA